MADPNDISVSDNQSCTLMGKFVNITENGTEVVDYYEYRCFEWDVMYGLVTWGIMLLPVLMPLPMARPVLLKWGKEILLSLSEVRDKRRRCAYYCLFALCALCALCFPFLLLGVKFVAAFNPGTEMKKLTRTLTEMEGTYESTWQFGLQLFVMLSRKDRMLSLQWTALSSLATSFVMINKAGVQAYRQYDNPNQAEGNMSGGQRTAVLLPMFIAANAFKLGSGALLVTIFSFPWTAFLYIVLFLIGVVLAFITTRNRPETSPLHWRHMAFHPFALVRFGPQMLPRSRICCRGQGNLEFSPEDQIRSLFRGNLFWFVGTSLAVTTAFAMSIFSPNMRILTFNFEHLAVIEYMLSDRGTLVTEAGPNITFIIVFTGLVTSGLVSLWLIRLEAGEMEESWAWKCLVGVTVTTTVMITGMVVWSQL